MSVCCGYRISLSLSVRVCVCVRVSVYVFFRGLNVKAEEGVREHEIKDRKALFGINKVEPAPFGSSCWRRCKIPRLFIFIFIFLGGT